MQKMIPATVVDRLIHVGNLPPLLMEGADLGTLADIDWINRTNSDVWKSVAERLATPELVALIKGVVVAERRLGWAGGSVAAAIWLFHELKSRDPLVAETIADWILPRTSNEWVPFGTYNLGARSVTEWRERERHLAATRQERRAGAEQQHARALAAAASRKEQALVDVQTQAASSQLRRELIQGLEGAGPAERLEAVASDTSRPVDFYPSTWARLTPDQVDGLSEDLRRKLLSRLHGRRRGPWRNLYLALRTKADIEGVTHGQGNTGKEGS